MSYLSRVFEDASKVQSVAIRHFADASRPPAYINCIGGQELSKTFEPAPESAPGLKI